MGRTCRCAGFASGSAIPRGCSTGRRKSDGIKSYVGSSARRLLARWCPGQNCFPPPSVEIASSAFLPECRRPATRLKSCTCALMLDRRQLERRALAIAAHRRRRGCRRHGGCSSARDATMPRCHDAATGAWQGAAPATCHAHAPLCRPGTLLDLPITG